MSDDDRRDDWDRPDPPDNNDFQVLIWILLIGVLIIIGTAGIWMGE